MGSGQRGLGIKEMCKVSVVVPVYNKAQYLCACLDSLVNQTLHDIEIICVDDKSTDESLDILKDYAAKDNRIQIIAFEKNKGVSAARNTGIDLARGEFLAFVDADDFVDLEFYDSLYSASKGYDCVKGEIWDYYTEINNCQLNTTYNLNERIKQSSNPIYFYYGYTSAIYKTLLVKENKIRFPEGISYYEDPYFSILMSTKLLSIKVVDGAMYFYRTVDSGLSHNINSKKASQLCESIHRILNSLKNSNLSHEDRNIIANQLFLMANKSENRVWIDNRRHEEIKSALKRFLRISPRENKANLSVIVPIYNGSKYLRAALDCLTLQSLYDIEIICVNDKSTDNSLEILQEYSKKDCRIRVIDCESNGGESVARNIGLRAASGEYVAFLDQDDLIDLFFYEKLYAKALETGSDIVKGQAVEVGLVPNDDVLQISAKQYIKNPLYFASEWWTAIYRRKMLSEHCISLPEGLPLGGDLKFLFDACRVCNQVVTVLDNTYYHIVHPDSGDSEITPLNKMESVIKVFRSIIDVLENDNMYEKDKECYIYYYSSYILHLFGRIDRCAEQKAKLLCIDNIFHFYKACKSKQEVLFRVKMKVPLLAYALENNQQEFFVQVVMQDTIGQVYYHRKTEIVKNSISCNIVVPYIDEHIIQKYIINNPFLKSEESIEYHYIDNRITKKPISVIYNEFLDKYDYEKESWLIFMHSDVELLDFPSNVLKDLNTSKIYGPVGAKMYTNKGKMSRIAKGSVIEKASDNSFRYYVPVMFIDCTVDTIDCMCIIVHSSLVKKYNLRYDENTILDLYAEDFCIQAKREHNIDTEIVSFDCAHHSSYFKEKYYSERYLNQLKYLNKKYSDNMYAGTVTPIGGKLLPFMSREESLKYFIRQEMLKGKKPLE